MSKQKRNQKKKGAVAPTPTVEQPDTVNQQLTEESVEEQSLQKPALTQEAPLQSQVVAVKIDGIVPNPMNPRRFFDEESLAELAKNIVEHGVLQPVTVREALDGDEKKYEIVFGERRYRAAKIAGLETIPCMIRELNDDEAFDMMISENLQRYDILPSEEGEAFKRILDKGKDIRYISERFGKSDSFIHGRLSLVRLIPEITKLLNGEEITIGMAVEISKMEQAIQENLLKEHLETEIVSNSWKNLPLKIFKEKLEAKYTVLLSRFSFDKSECEQCTFNSEYYSLFPSLENSRCTRSTCLVKKQENYMLEKILSAIGNDNADVYLNQSESIYADIVERLGELGIEVKQGTVHRMPENPVMPVEDDFEDNPAGYEQAKKDYETKLTKWNDAQELLEKGLARKAFVLDAFVPYFGYVMVEQTKESVEENSDDNDTPDNTKSKPVDGDNSGNSENSSPKTDNKPAKPELMEKLEQKDRKNREEALCKVVDDIKKMIKEVYIQPSEIMPFEDALINYVLLSFFDIKHYEYFGLPEERKMTEEEKVELYPNLTAEQKNLLKRDFLIHAMTHNTSGINKKSALLIEFVKHHFPEEASIIENTHNEEYLKKRRVIQEQMDKLNAKKEENEENEDLQDVA